jgi:hypothetical protein
MGTKVCPGFEEEPEMWVLDEQLAAEVPGERECMPCYVRRMMDLRGCLQDFRWVRRWQAEHQPELIDWLKREGAWCDCEVLRNIYPEHGDEHVTLPPCTHGAVADPGR